MNYYVIYKEPQTLTLECGRKKYNRLQFLRGEGRTVGFYRRYKKHSTSFRPSQSPTPSLISKSLHSLTKFIDITPSAYQDLYLIPPDSPQSPEQALCLRVTICPTTLKIGSLLLEDVGMAQIQQVNSNKISSCPACSFHQRRRSMSFSVSEIL